MHVISERSLQGLFIEGRVVKSNSNETVYKLPIFLKSEALKPYLPADFETVYEPITFIAHGGQTIQGYNAEIVVKRLQKERIL